MSEVSEIQLCSCIPESHILKISKMTRHWRNRGQGGSPSSNSFSMLPREVLEHIFHYLVPKDLKAVVLVNRKCWSVGEGAPKLWTWVKMRRIGGPPLNNISTGLEMLRKRKFEGIETLEAFCLKDYEVEELMRVVVDHPRLDKLDLLGQLGRVKKDWNVRKPSWNLTLVNAVSKLVKIKINLASIQLPEQQSAALCFSSLQGCSIETLRIGRVDLSSVAPQVSTWEATLGVAIANIVELRLNDTKLKPDQCIAIFSALVESEKLTCLDLSDNSLSAVPPHLLASVLTRAREGYLRRGDLTPPQAVALLEASLDQDSKLEILDLCAVDLSTVDIKLLAEAVNKLESVYLYNTGMDRDKVSYILQQSLLGTRLKMLDVGEDPPWMFDDKVPWVEDEEEDYVEEQLKDAADRVIRKLELHTFDRDYYNQDY